MDVPKALDWVAARVACSVDKRFELLGQVVESDVAAIRSVHTRSKCRFRFSRSSAAIHVVRETLEAYFVGDVVFTHDSTSITVSTRNQKREAHPMFVAKPAVNQAGVCRLEIDGQPMELWQVSRKALEGLFFGD